MTTDIIRADAVRVNDTVHASTDYLVTAVETAAGQVLHTDSHGTVYAMGPDHEVTVSRPAEQAEQAARDLARRNAGRATARVAKRQAEAAAARQTAADVAELAQLIHSAVAVSDKHGGTLSPFLAGRVLRQAIRSLDDASVAIAVDIASDARGRRLEGAPAVPPF